MKWIKKNYRTVLLWLILIAVAPVFAEILFIANIVGVEVAFAFLLLLLKDMKQNTIYFIHRLKSFMKEAVNILQNHPIFQINVYFAHSALSVLMLAFTGSLAFSILIWYPAILGSYFIV